MYAVEVLTGSDEKWYGNGLTFPTTEKAREYAVDLFSRWTSVTNWRVVEVFLSWGGKTSRVEVERKAA